MTTLPLNSNSSFSALAVLGTLRLGNSQLANTSQQSATTVANPTSNDTVTLSKEATQRQDAPSTPQGVASPDFFASYLDALQQQQIGRSLIQKDLTATGNKASGQMSVLNNFQTLQYQKSVYESVFNLRSNIFLSIFDITA